MVSKVKKHWNRILRIGLHAEMDQGQQMRLFIVNAFLCISLVLTLVCIISFVLMGSYKVLQGIVLIPIILLVFLLNAKRKFRAARFVVTYGLMVIVLVLALADRRTGTEYILIAIGCCSVIVFNKASAIIASFLFAFICYVTYIWVDATLPFLPDPNTPYIIVENSLMFLSAFAVMTQSLVFRRLVNKYALSLSRANKNIHHINEELKSANEELVTLSERLDMLVKEKSAELQAYLDTININLYSAATDCNGTILRVNKPLVDATGFSEEELIGKNFRILNSGLYPKSTFEGLYKAIQSGKSWRGEIRNKTKDGVFFWVDMVIMPVVSSNNEIAYCLCLALPITDRKKAEEFQRKNSEVFEEIANETSHRVRGPMARIMGIINLTESNNIKANELLWVSAKLKENIIELDQATSALTLTVNNHSKKRMTDDGGIEPT